MAMARSAPFAVFVLVGQAFAPAGNLLVGNARLAGVQSSKTSAMGRLQAWSPLVQSVGLPTDRGQTWCQSKPNFLSVRVLADQVGELMQVGDHGIGLDRGVIRGRFNMTLNAGTRRFNRRRYSAAAAAGWPAR